MDFIYQYLEWIGFFLKRCDRWIGIAPKAQPFNYASAPERALDPFFPVTLLY